MGDSDQNKLILAISDVLWARQIERALMRAFPNINIQEYSSLPSDDLEGVALLITDESDIEAVAEGIEIIGISGDAAISPASLPANISVLTAPFKMGQFMDLVKSRLLLQVRQNWKEDDFIILSAGHGYRLYPLYCVLKNADGDLVINVTDKERDILVCLYQHKGESLTKKQLLNLVWGYRADLETHTVETHIYRLRQKLEAIQGLKNIIKTTDKGYSLG